MYKKCWGCNQYNIFIFRWLAGNNICAKCEKSAPNYKTFEENYNKNSSEYWNKLDKKNQKIDNFLKTKTPIIKDSVKFIFGAIGLLYFVLMLVAQPDFEGIVVGWAIIGGIYLIFRIFYR
jgi:hypothetical protein